jgi:hypothetical protein
LTDQDRRFGPITYGRSDWAAFRAVFSSGDDEKARNSLTVNAFGWVARVWLPTLIQPHKVKCTATYWSAEDIARMGRDWYYEISPREFGLCISDGHLSVYYGEQTDSSLTTKRRGWFLPWRQWRHVRYSLYDRNGRLFWEQRKKKDIRGIKAFTDQYDAEKACPAASFLIRDYDGEQVTARTVIDEREWRFGEGWFRWLSWLRAPKIRRSLKIEFSAEVGTQKGSWKGGLVGTGIDMLPGELHESAMRRYCAKEHCDKGGKYRITFLSIATQSTNTAPTESA